MPEKLDSYLMNKDIVNVRRELIKILMVNPKVSDGVFKNALRKAEQELGTDLYEQGSNTFEKKVNRKQWTADYLSKIIRNLRSEFSKDLVKHAIEVADAAYPSVTASKDLDQHQPIHMSSKEEKPVGKMVLMGIGIILLIIIIAGLLH
ncbi:MAG: hypothetical protein PUF29_17495 [Anaerobutyricum hallii]|uniref:hypothetical protein n=1 Tax=Anaerobutyricum hallii TaxID=39488 RepID=UPI00243109D3|nr:hypothetical protein [Anaerobutyricum hallii]MDD6590349.1 hypothetical protein [Anaerobutyricum hallii]